MISRRSFFGGVAGIAAYSGTQSYANELGCSIYSAERQRAVTPTEAVDILKQGNARFATGQSINCDLIEQVHQTADHQYPFAAILGCIDSRVPPELVFDQRIGDVFCARVAGNIASTEIIGSLEYATAVAGAKAIIVLGHSSCGAIKSAMDGVELGNITTLLKHIGPTVDALATDGGPMDSLDAAAVQKVAEANARRTAQAILERSELIRELVSSGELILQVAMHDVKSGLVTWPT